MALTRLAPVGGASRMDHMTHGLQLMHVELAINPTGPVGQNPTEYALTSGFDIQGSAGKWGMRKVYMVLHATIRRGSTLVQTLPLWDQSTGRLRFFNSSTTEISNANLVNGDVLSMVVVGV